MEKEQKILKENEQLNDFKKKNAELVEKNNILTKQHDNIVDEIKNFTEGYGKIISNSDRMLVLHTNKRDDYIVFCKNCNKQHDVDGTTYLIFDKLQHKFRHYCAVCFKQTTFADMESDKKQTTLNLHCLFLPKDLIIQNLTKITLTKFILTMSISWIKLV